MKNKLILTIAIGASLLVSACAASTDTAAGADDDSHNDTAANFDPMSGDGNVVGDNGAVAANPFDTPVTLINASSSDEGQTTLNDLIDGDKPVVLWSYAAWCVNCMREAPDIDAFAEANPDVQVIGIGALDSAEASVGFIQDTGVQNSTMVWAGEDAGLWQQLGFTGRTENLVLSPDLTSVAGPNLGGFEADEVLSQITSLA